jgi:predicted signal transduction protein with EAL and GGDEF domain
VGGERDLGVKYQPKVEVATGRIVGARGIAALARPVLGDVPPSVSSRPRSG